MKAIQPNVKLASASQNAPKVAAKLDKLIASDPIAKKMVDDVSSAYKKYGVVDDRAVQAMFQRAIIGDVDADPAFSTQQSAVEGMLSRAKAAKPGDKADAAQEAAITHIRAQFGDKMSAGAKKTLDVVDKVAQCQRENTPIPKALVDELKGDGALSAGNASALAYVRKQYVSSIPPMLMDHIDSMLNSWSMSVFDSGLEESAQQARQQEESNALAFQQMVDADSKAHDQLSKSHSAHVGKKHEIQFAKLEFKADKMEVAEASDEVEVGREEVNEGDVDYSIDQIAAAETDEIRGLAADATTSANGGASSKKSSQATMLNVRFPGTSRRT